MKRNRRAIRAAAVFALAAGVSGGVACAASSARSFPVEAADVAPRVMVSMAAPDAVVAASQVTMLARVVAASAHPELEVTSMTRWDSLRNKAKVVCRSSAECLPFYVFVTWPDKDSAARAVEAFRPGTCGDPCGDPGCERGAGKKSARAALGVAAVAASAAGASERAPKARSNESVAQRSEARPAALVATTLRAGAHALLAIDEDGIHIRVPVTCLENGAPGKRIRVLARDRRQVYLAEVLGDNSLKGTL